MVHISQRISIKNCELNWVHVDAFEGLAVIGSLRLTDGYLRKAPSLQYIRETITTLDLDNNHIRIIDKTYFAGCVRLRAIHLQNNLLSIVPNINYVASSITTLYLSDNKLNEPRLNLTQSFPRFHLLYLACNNISSFCMHETGRLLNLQVLDLSANTITHFDFQLIPHQHRNLFIALGGNPLRCKELINLNKICKIDRNLNYACERFIEISVSDCVNHTGQFYKIAGVMNLMFLMKSHNLIICQD